jgi:SAM-dependent methyltransferase
LTDLPEFSSSGGGQAEVATPPTIDDVAAYWNRQPCNIRHSGKEIGTREYFDEVEARKYFVEPHIPGFAEFPAWRRKKVLEIGCGIGTDAVNFARNGAIYTAIELSSESLKLTRRRFTAYDLPGTFYEGNAEKLDAIVQARDFDLIYSFGVVHHTPNPRKVVEAARRVIADDGELRMMLYAKNSWKDIMIGAGLDRPEAQAGCQIAFTYTKDQIRELLDGLFRINDIRVDHIFPYVIEKYRNYEYELQPWFKAMPPRMFRALETSLGWHTLVKAKPI